MSFLTREFCGLQKLSADSWCGPDVKLLREFRNDDDPTAALCARQASARPIATRRGLAGEVERLGCALISPISLGSMVPGRGVHLLENVVGSNAIRGKMIGQLDGSILSGSIIHLAKAF